MKRTAGLLVGLGVLVAATIAGAAKDETITATLQGTDAPRLDVVFCVDTTGSMADEIEVVKTKLREMVAKVASGEPTPDVRFGLVIYRDRGDEYVTKRYELTRDIDQVVQWINGIVAHKGGDYPESVNEALHVAVQEMEWDPAPSVSRLIFLIGDAPPHLDYEGDYDYREEGRQAFEKGIVIDTIGCSGLKEEDQAVFQEVANTTLGTFELLTYMREYVKADGKKEMVVSAGAALYALGEGAKEDEWREGAERLAARGRVAKVSTEAPGGEMPAPTGPKGDPGPAGPSESAAEIPAAGMTARGGGYAMPVVGSENNLDSLLTRQVQLQLSRQGVRYADQPYLPAREWRGGTCAETTRRALVARDKAEWQEIWTLVAEAEGSSATPSVDFARDMVLAAFGGEGWKGRTVRIDDVWQDEEGLHVRVGRGPDDAETTSPYHIIVVSRYGGDILWK